MGRFNFTGVVRANDVDAKFPSYRSGKTPPSTVLAEKPGGTSEPPGAAVRFQRGRSRIRSLPPGVCWEECSRKPSRR